MWDREGRRTQHNRSLSTVTFKRADGSIKPLAFVGSPELVTAMAIAEFKFQSFD
jgi:hypothetical protein